MTPSTIDPPREAFWDVPLARAAWVFFDLEMTGLDPARDAICELAAIRVEGGAEVARLTSLVRAPSVGASGAVHGITDEALEGAPELAALAPAWRALLDGAIAVGHRVAFDLAFLHAAQARGALDAPAHALDTHALAQRCLHASSYGLRGLCAELGLAAPSHRAEPDAEACRALFGVVTERLRAATPRHLWQAQQKLRPPAIRDDVRAAIALAHERRSVVRFAYRVPGRAPIEDVLEPWAIAWPRVEGRVRGKAVTRVLRGDRFLWAEALEVRFEPPARFVSALSASEAAS